MQFTRLHLEKWRNFYEVDVSVRSRAFVVGPNASGKSNLLDAIRFLRDVASVGGGFQEAIQKRGGVSKIRSLSARRYPGVGVSVHIGENGQEGLMAVLAAVHTGQSAEANPDRRRSSSLRRGWS
jgi:recombinational DNA repair ATPase RecF